MKNVSIDLCFADINLLFELCQKELFRSVPLKHSFLEESRTRRLEKLSDLLSEAYQESLERSVE